MILRVLIQEIISRNSINKSVLAIVRMPKSRTIAVALCPDYELAEPGNLP